MTRPEAVADAANAQASIPRRVGLLPYGVALLFSAVAALPLLASINAYSLSSFVALLLLSTLCAFQIAHKEQLTLSAQTNQQLVDGSDAGGWSWSGLLLNVLPVWEKHMVFSKTQVEVAITDLVGNFASITEEFESAGFKGTTDAASEGSDETSAVLALCEQDLRVVISAMSDISRSKAEMTSSMQELSEAAKDLQTMTNGVAQIAAQTNLLAINAAIEAAHAGDKGRGFATIAKEIRELSQSSAKTASQITERIKCVTDIMRGTSAVAAKAADQEKVIVDQSSQAVNGVISHMHQLSADSQSMRERGNAIRNNIEQLIVSMQFQDRVSQVLSVVVGDMTRMRDQVERDEPAPDTSQWLHELEGHYTMQEQHCSTSTANASHETAKPASKAVFF